jgi:hypothetical protein
MRAFGGQGVQFKYHHLIRRSHCSSLHTHTRRTRQRTVGEGAYFTTRLASLTGDCPAIHLSDDSDRVPDFPTKPLCRISHPFNAAKASHFNIISSSQAVIPVRCPILSFFRTFCNSSSHFVGRVGLLGRVRTTEHSDPIGSSHSSDSQVLV